MRWLASFLPQGKTLSGIINSIMCTICHYSHHEPPCGTSALPHNAIFQTQELFSMLLIYFMFPLLFSITTSWCADPLHRWTVYCITTTKENNGVWVCVCVMLSKCFRWLNVKCVVIELFECSSPADILQEMRVQLYYERSGSARNMDGFT